MTYKKENVLPHLEKQNLPSHFEWRRERFHVHPHIDSPFVHSYKDHVRKGEHDKGIKSHYFHGFPNLVIPPCWVRIPGPWIIRYFIAFNRGEFHVVEEPVD